MKLTQLGRQKMLQDLRNVGASGQAEAESPGRFARGFLPIPEHAKALEPDVVLVVGDRGSGKSELFRSVMDFNLVPDILRYSPEFRSADFDISAAKWIKAHPIGSEFPDDSALRRLFESKGRNIRELSRDLWKAYLVRILHKQYPKFEDKAIANRLKALFVARAASASEVLEAFYASGDEPTSYLDSFDKNLLDSKSWVFVGYDELDTLGSYDWSVLEDAVSGLISFWAGYSRRWLRLRAKIFIRTDIFNRNNKVLGADLPKLAANRAELTWSDKNLYALLFKRIINLSPDFGDYAKGALPKNLTISKDKVFGLVPSYRHGDDFRPFFEKMISPFMGASYKKGLTYKWILDHVRDGHGKALPRALVVLFESAALHEVNVPGAGGNSLISPVALRKALSDVSKFYVLQANNHEWPWLEGVGARIGGSQVPVDREKLESHLEERWGGKWGQDSSIRPPEQHAVELVDYMIDLGVFRVRSDGRLDVPDLYLEGLGLKRKGGVKKD